LNITGQSLRGAADEPCPELNDTFIGKYEKESSHLAGSFAALSLKSN